MHHVYKHKHSLYVYSEVLENSSILTVWFIDSVLLAISKHAQSYVQSQQ